MEERWNAITHGVGALLALVGCVLLVIWSCLRGEVWHIVSFSIYGVSLVLLYLASTLYHSFRREKLKHMFKIFDHAAIYLLIAGTYTPFTLVLLHGTLGWSVFVAVWTMAVIGIILQVFFVNRFKVVSTVCYVLMGWFIVMFIKPLVVTLPLVALCWLIVGGLFYTVGSLFYLRRWFPYHHAVWHVFVMAGSICHYIAVMKYVLPVPVVS